MKGNTSAKKGQEVQLHSTTGIHTGALGLGLLVDLRLSGVGGLLHLDNVDKVAKGEARVGLQAESLGLCV